MLAQTTAWYGANIQATGPILATLRYLQLYDFVDLLETAQLFEHNRVDTAKRLCPGNRMLWLNSGEPPATPLDFCVGQLNIMVDLALDS